MGIFYIHYSEYALSQLRLQRRFQRLLEEFRYLRLTGLSRSTNKRTPENLVRPHISRRHRSQQGCVGHWEIVSRPAEEFHAGPLLRIVGRESAASPHDLLTRLRITETGNSRPWSNGDRAVTNPLHLVFIGPRAVITAGIEEGYEGRCVVFDYLDFRFRAGSFLTVTPRNRVLASVRDSPLALVFLPPATAPKRRACALLLALGIKNS